MKQVLPVALKYSNNMFEDDWTFQQDGTRPHIHENSQEWYTKNFPSFINKDHWPPSSPDLNPLDYCVWNQVAQVKHSDIEKDTDCAREKDFVFESCLSWTNRLHRMFQDKGNYLK